MDTTFKGTTITTQDVLAAIGHFDAQYPDANAYDSWLEKAVYKFALDHNGKLYPCKYILSQASGIDTTEFSGGPQTNRVFQRLGFHIITKPSSHVKRA